MEMDLSDETVRISVDAVGGPDSDSGREMYRLLMDRMAQDEKPDDVAPAPAIEQKTEDDVLTPALEHIFSRVFAPVPDAPAAADEAAGDDGTAGLGT